MDVRCEKCQTEYELDESRLKPGGVTVKCTNCGHMFKIHKRTPTNVGSPGVGTSPGIGAKSPAPQRADSIFEGPTTVERQWVIRLENGEQKTCRELATLQQWIVGNVVTRESLISRTGKTWKRLGDISELAQYFEIADEARRTRGEKDTKPTGPDKKTVPPKGAAGTMLGVGSAATAAGGTILPDDEDEGRSTGSYRSQGTKRPTTNPPPVPARTPPMGSNVATPATQGSGPLKRPLTAPPGPPPQTKRTPTGPVPQVPQASEPRPAQATPAPPKPTPAPPLGPDARNTASWASDPIKTTGVAPSGPYVGKLSAIPDEPAFTGSAGAGAGGRLRMGPADESSFETGKVGLVDDDDMMPARRGSRAGLIVLLMMLIVGAGAAALVYAFVIKKSPKTDKAAVVADAGVPADAASLVVTPMVDVAPEPPPLSPVEAAAGELLGDNEARMRASLESLPKDAPETQAVRANLGAAIAQALIDRAGLVADKAEAEKLRKESKAIVLEAATAAQRAVKAAPDDAAANIAMAHVLRLQGKSAKDMQRYIDAAKAKGDAKWSRDVALAEALVLARDGKLDDARKALEGIDAGPGKLETSNDVRARFHRALIALAANKAADAKPLVDQILAAQPEHAGAKALAAKLETKVSSQDPLPPEDPGKGSNTGSAKPNPNPNPNPDVSTGGGYDQLLARANKLAETNCTKAMELYAKALEQKPNGVEALAGQGYCHIDAKQFASAHSKFRSALAISSRFEPALWGIAEAYQQQGRREQAIEAYKAYLDVYPNTAKALKQIERLSGTPAGSGSAPTPPTPPTPGEGSTAQPQKPDAPKDPTPTPTPVPEGGGSGTQ
jgi:predicted Zn finger-like uncharacterized protein